MDRVFASNSTIINTDSEFIIEIKQNEIPFLALELSMLLMGLVKVVIIIFKDDSRLKISLNKDLPKGKKAIFLSAQKNLSVSFSETHIKYLRSFLLKAYRDQAAEVNHLHIEGMMKARPYDLTLLFDNYKLPLTPDKARKLMNI